MSVFHLSGMMITNVQTSKNTVTTKNLENNSETAVQQHVTPKKSYAKTWMSAYPPPGMTLMPSVAGMNRCVNSATKIK